MAQLNVTRHTPPASRRSDRRARLQHAHARSGRSSRTRRRGPRSDRLRADGIGQDRRVRPRLRAATAWRKRRRGHAAAPAPAARTGHRADARTGVAGRQGTGLAIRRCPGTHFHLRRRHGRVQGAPLARPRDAYRRRHAWPLARPPGARRARPVGAQGRRARRSRRDARHGFSRGSRTDPRRNAERAQDHVVLRHHAQTDRGARAALSARRASHLDRRRRPWPR